MTRFTAAEAESMNRKYDELKARLKADNSGIREREDLLFIIEWMEAMFEQVDERINMARDVACNRR